MTHDEAKKVILGAAKLGVMQANTDVLIAESELEAAQAKLASKLGKRDDALRRLESIQRGYSVPTVPGPAYVEYISNMESLGLNHFDQH